MIIPLPIYFINTFENEIVSTIEVLYVFDLYKDILFLNLRQN